MGKKIESKFFAVKRTGEGTNINVDFVPKVRTYSPPIITESFIDDNGDMQHILESGNTISENNFVKVWGKGTGIVNMKAKTEKINPNPFTLK